MKKAVAIVLCSLVLLFLTTSVMAQASPQDLAGGGDELIDVDGDGIPDCIAEDGLHCDACLHGVLENGFCKPSGDKNNDDKIDDCDKYFKEDKTQGQMFVRGDSNGDEKVDITDAIYTLNFLFQGGDELGCQDAADINDDGKIDITDAIYTLNFLFSGGDPPQVVSSSWYACEGEDVKDRCLSIQPDFPTAEDDRIKWETCQKKDFNKDGTKDCWNVQDQCQCTWKFWYYNDPQKSWCDIYSHPSKVDSLTCIKGITKLLTTKDACDPERKDENRNGISNEGCDNLPPQPYIIAPGSPETPFLYIPAYASFPQTDYGFKILDLSRGYDLAELNVKLISGKEGVDPDNLAEQIDLRTLKDFFTLEPSLDKLNIQGLTSISITGEVKFWEGFQSKFNNFPKNTAHTMRFILTDKDVNGKERSSSIDMPWRYEVEESDSPGFVWRGDQNLPAGSTVSPGLRIFDQSEEDCTCSDIEMYYQWVQCTSPQECSVSNNLPFPPASFYVQGFNADRKGQEGPFTLRTFDGSMEVLGESPYTSFLLQGQLHQTPLRTDILGRPMDEYGVGDISGIIPLSTQQSRELRNRDGQEGLYYQYPITYDGFHYQVKAKTRGNCILTEFIQSTAKNRKDVKHLACSEWYNSLQQWPPSSEDMKKPVLHEYVSAGITGKSAGIGLDYSCPNGFTPRDQYSPSWGYTNDAGPLPQGVYFENIIKKKSGQGPVLQNTVMQMRNQDPKRGIAYRLFDVVGLPDQGAPNSPGVKCGCTMDLMYSEGSWKVIKDPKCEVYNSPGR